MPQVVQFKNRLLLGNIAPPREAEGCGAPGNTREESEAASGDSSTHRSEDRRQSPASSPRPAGKCDAAFKYPGSIQGSLAARLPSPSVCTISHGNRSEGNCGNAHSSICPWLFSRRHKVSSWTQTFWMFLERHFLQVQSVSLNKALLQKGTNTWLLSCRLQLSLPSASGYNTNYSVSGFCANTDMLLQIH